MTDFHEKFINAVKAAGLDIAENAEAYIGETNLLSDITITITFDPEYNMLNPTINVDKDYLSGKAMSLMQKYRNEEHNGK